MKTLARLTLLTLFYQLFSGKNRNLNYHSSTSSTTSTTITTEVPAVPTLAPTEKATADSLLPASEANTASMAKSVASAAQQVVEETAPTAIVEPSGGGRALTELPVAENSTIASDIDRIWHEPETKEICVALKPNARCPHPYLIGRLSGPGLAILDWKYRQDSEEKGMIMCGSYGHYWLDAADYYVEILIVFCKDFGVKALERKDDEQAWANDFHRFKCVEDARRNQITATDGSAVINVATSQTGTGPFRKAHYVRKPGLPNKPLFRKIQPAECLKFWKQKNDGTALFAWCDSQIKRDFRGNSRKGQPPTGIFEYEIQWNTRESEDTYQQVIRQRIQDGNLPKICGIGDSHTRHMVIDSLKTMNLKGAFEEFNHPFPNPQGYPKFMARKFGDNCDVIFSQVGQWPAANMIANKKADHPMTFQTYYDKVKLHVKNIIKHNKGNPDVTFYLPSMDYNALGGFINQCRDWRTPTYLESFSLMNQKIAHDLNLEMNNTQVRTINIDHIVQPVWDGGGDWQHLQDYTRERKTFYMLSVMLGYEAEWFLE